MISVNDLARQMGISRDAVKMRMDRLGIKPMTENKAYFLSEENAEKVRNYKNIERKNRELMALCSDVRKFILEGGGLLWAGTIREKFNVSSQSFYGWLYMLTFRMPDLYEEDRGFDKLMLGINTALSPKNAEMTI